MWKFATAAGLVLTRAALPVATAQPLEMDLFTGGIGGYDCYRLPNLVQMNTPGHLLALGQGRTDKECPDSGPMDSLARVTTDNGRTWSDPQLVWPNAARQTMGTPTAIHDAQGDIVFLFMNPQHGGRDAADGRRVLLFEGMPNATDGGQLQWSDTPRDLTSALVPDAWDNVWMGTQQGITVDLPGGGKRLIMCANHHSQTGSNGAHTVYSDDHGVTWRNGETLSEPAGIGECGLAQTAAGVYLYGRVVYDNPNITKSRRMLALSTDYGHSFSPGNTAVFPGNPGADAEGAFIGFGGRLLVGSAYGQVGPSNPGRHNYTVLQTVLDAAGKVTTWTKVPGADPLWPGIEAEYSTMVVPSLGKGAYFWVASERGDIYNEGVGPTSSIRLKSVPFPAYSANLPSKH